MNEQERRLYRDDLRTKFKSIVNFEEKFIFWQNYQAELIYLDDSIHIGEYIKAQKDTRNVYRLATIRNSIYKEYEEMGLYEPIPITNEEKAFVGKYWFHDSLSFRKKENPPIYDYETYKIVFFQEVNKKADKLEYTNKEITKISNYLESLTFNNEIVFLLNEGKKSVRAFFEDLTNNNKDFTPDFIQLYECSLLASNILLDLYFLASYHIPLNQYKRFLKMYVEKNGLIETYESNLRGYNLGFSEEQLNKLYFMLIEAEFLSTNTKLSHFINAFNGGLLCDDFEAIKWKNKTKGAIFIKHYFGDGGKHWHKCIHLFEKANYKQLLSQSNRVNNTLSLVIEKLITIDKAVSKY